jgi:ABC-2 type transport system ATP-binding protein
VQVEGLRKVYGATVAVDSIDLSIPRGSVYGVLGPNGAGKTTTINILATLLAPDGGTAKVLGRDVVTEGDAVRSLVSLTGQFASVDEDLTGQENLIMIARLFGFDRRKAKVRADALLEGFGLAESSRKLAKNYSGGMRRRLDIAASIVVTPAVLFLDEPTTGLDPRARRQVWDIVRSLAGQGTTILLCTQYLDEAEQLAERIAVFDHGRVIAEGTPGELRASVGGNALRVRLLELSQRAEAERILEATLEATAHSEADPLTITVACADAGRAARAVAALENAAIGLADFSVVQPSLDDVFLALTGHKAEAA